MADEIDRLNARIAELEDAAVWLLRHVTGRCLRANGYILDDTSDLSEFLRAHALKGEQNKQKT